MSPPSPLLPNRNPNNKFHHKPISSSSLPDLFFTAISLLFLYSSSSSSSSSTIKPLHHHHHPLFFNFKIPPFPQNPRRLFLKNPIMSQSKRNPNHHFFSSPQSLSDWLKPRLPSDSFSSWGVKPGTKNVHNLWLEISEGETSLLDSTPPVRTVDVVSVRIHGVDGKILVESHQELSDGTIRERFRPLSEKMKPGETVEEAVFRAVKEELGSIIGGEGSSSSSSISTSNSITNGIVRIVEGSYQKKVEERVSVSYPGLPACYVLHSVEAWVDGLPEKEFSTEEGEEYSESNETKVADKALFVKKHFWKWVESDSI